MFHFLRKINKLRTGGHEDLVGFLRSKGAKIGERVLIAGATLDPSYPFLIEIGDDSVLSSCHVLTHDASSQPFCGYSRVGKVIIGKQCFIGADTIILPGSVIEDKTIIGAGSLVAGHVPGDGVFIGRGNLRKLMTYEEFAAKAISLKENGKAFDMHWSTMSSEDKNYILSQLAPGEIGFLR